jgi:hypothetical protein
MRSDSKMRRKCETPGRSVQKSSSKRALTSDDI